MPKHPRRRMAIPVALAALLALPGLASATRVSFRVEGAHRTLVQREVTLPGGRVGADGKATCPGNTVLGALDAGTHGRWSGTFYSSFSDYLISRILGERPRAPAYWTLWVNDRSSSTGACATKPKQGDRILFFLQPGKALPLGLRVPTTAQAGESFRVRVVKFSENGATSPVRGATVSGGGAFGRTNAQGYARVRVYLVGRLALRATAPGLIRSESETLRVKAVGRCGSTSC